MSILCLGDHRSRSEHLTEMQLGFKYVEVDRGTALHVANKKEKYLFFILEGKMKVGYNEFTDKEFSAGEMFFLPKSADFHGKALTKCSFIVHIYDAPMRSFNKEGINSIINCKPKVRYEFKSLPICSTLDNYLLLLKRYLGDGITCRHLQEIKQKELLWVLLTYYSKEDLAQFFYPMVGKSLDFRSSVMAYYMDAKTAKQLAAYCGYSEIYFYDLFIVEFGETPYKWMQKQKANHIVGRLSQSNMSIKEIIDEFGFSSRCHFNKFCKRQYGDTAVKVRADLLSNNQ